MTKNNNYFKRTPRDFLVWVTLKSPAPPPTLKNTLGYLQKPIQQSKCHKYSSFLNKQINFIAKIVLTI